MNNYYATPQAKEDLISLIGKESYQELRDRFSAMLEHGEESVSEYDFALADYDLDADWFDTLYWDIILND